MVRKRIIYLDNCCYSRLFDNKTQNNVKAEVAKIRSIIRNRFLGEYDIIGGLTVILEIRKIRDNRRRSATERLYNRVIVGNALTSPRSIIRANELNLKGIGYMDSLHLAAAEAAKADYLLTTDIDFIKKCSKPNFTTVKVINPLDF